jgi:hypothetical protein
MIALLLAGTVVFCAGVLAIVFGIPIKEFSFGNTMILCGAVMSSTGLILIGLGILAREVKQLSRRLGSVPRGVEEAEVAEIVVAEVPPPAPAMPDAPPRTAPRAAISCFRPAAARRLHPRPPPSRRLRRATKTICSSRHGRNPSGLPRRTAISQASRDIRCGGRAGSRRLRAARSRRAASHSPRSAW